MIAQKIHQHLYAMKAEIDLTCLNSPQNNSGNCARYDFNETLYINKNGTYIAASAWKPFKIKLKFQKDSSKWIKKLSFFSVFFFLPSSRITGASFQGIRY